MRFESRDMPPAVAARLMAWRYSIPWERLNELEEELGVRERLHAFSAARSAFDHPSLDATAAAWDVLEASGLYRMGHNCDDFTDFFQLCESPIEELFGAAALAAEGCGDVAIVPQWQIGSFRVDFAVYPYAFARRNGASLALRPSVAVELDGHEFHERTKAQAARDKSRDRRLVAAGWSVLRFTGSEVWRDPFACVTEAFELAHRLDLGAA